MKLFTFNIEYDQGVTYQFAQDDIRRVGKQRVASVANVAAPDRELAEFFLRRSLTHAGLTIIGEPLELEIHLFVHGTGQTFVPVQPGKPVGPEQIEPYWQARIDRDR